MKAFSTFTGIGGFELGFRQAKIPIEWVGHSEIDRFADAMYTHHFSSPNYGDISQIDGKTLPDFDLLTGGFPCQAFSSLGKRYGFKDARGRVFFDLVRLLQIKSPEFFMLENVRGLLSHDQGRTFQIVVKTLADLGYCVQWQVCDSADFGIAQHRERVFLFGNLGNEPCRQVFPVISKNPIPAQAPTRLRIAVASPRKRKLRRGCRRFKSPGEPMFTLTTSNPHGVLDGNRIRQLTPLEYERLQGFPDNWTKWGAFEDGRRKMMSDFQRYKCLGNAVTVPVVVAIAKRMFPEKCYEYRNSVKKK